jgi:hypothetical protein
MRTIERTIDIPAPPATVWEVLSRTDDYGRWNPFVTRLDGAFAVGERLRVTLHAGRRTMTFRPRVVAHEPGRLLRWQGRLGVPGLFDGRHELRLEPTGTGTRFVHSERFTGLLVPVLSGTLADTEAGFVAMNEALREESLRRQDTGPSEAGRDDVPDDL